MLIWFEQILADWFIYHRVHNIFLDTLVHIVIGRFVGMRFALALVLEASSLVVELVHSIVLDIVEYIVERMKVGTFVGLAFVVVA